MKKLLLLLALALPASAQTVSIGQLSNLSWISLYYPTWKCVFANGADATNQWHLGQGGFRLDWDATNHNLLTLQGDLYDGRIAQPNTNDMVVTGGTNVYVAEVEAALNRQLQPALHCSILGVERLERLRIDALGLLAPRPLTLANAGDKAFDKTARIYKLAGAGDKLIRK